MFAFFWKEKKVFRWKEKKVFRFRFIFCFFLIALIFLDEVEKRLIQSRSSVETPNKIHMSPSAEVLRLLDERAAGIQPSNQSFDVLRIGQRVVGGGEENRLGARELREIVLGRSRLAVHFLIDGRSVVVHRKTAVLVFDHRLPMTNVVDTRSRRGISCVFHELRFVDVVGVEVADERHQNVSAELARAGADLAGDVKKFVVGQEPLVAEDLENVRDVESGEELEQQRRRVIDARDRRQREEEIDGVDILLDAGPVGESHEHLDCAL